MLTDVSTVLLSFAHVDVVDVCAVGLLAVVHADAVVGVVVVVVVVVVVFGDAV